MHPALKRAFERLLARLGPARLARARMRGRVLVLAYHNVVPDAAAPAGDRALHLTHSSFARELDFLQRWFDVVPVAALPHLGPGGERPRAVITFDDGYRGAVTVGLAELKSRGLPATVFLAPALLNDHTFWWDALAEGPEGLDCDLRRRALAELRGEDAAIRAWALTGGLRAQAVPELLRSATESELGAAAYPGLTLGSHSWSHPNLSALDSAEMDRELHRSRQWLEQRFGPSFVPWLTFPYGLVSASLLEAVRAAGYAGAFRIEGGWLRPPASARFDLPRLNVPSGLSLDGFSLRASGLVAW